VKFSVLMEYLRACRIPVVIVFFVVFLLANVFSIASNYWLSYWSNKSSGNNSQHGNVSNNNATAEHETAEKKKYYYYLVFVLIGVAQCVFTLASDFAYLVMYYFATKMLHNKLLHSMLRSTMEFFESTPSGRIINRFSKDVEATERGIPESFKTFCRCFFHVVFTILVILISTPLFITVLVPILIIYIFVQVDYYFVNFNIRLKYNSI
jgi:ATP-binding cassette subfamily C (CFTR/MRP) protein 1